MLCRQSQTKQSCPVQIVVLVTKAVSDYFGKGGIADQMIRFNGFPLLESDDHAYNVSGSSFSPLFSLV